MTPEVSRATARVIAELELGPGAVKDELLAAAQGASSIADLPRWARAVHNAINKRS